MDPDVHLAHLRADAAAVVAAARAEPDAPVPSCPGWDRTKLIAHLCVPLGWATAQVIAGPDEKKGFRDAARPAEGEDVFAFFDGVVERADAALAAIDLGATFPTWAGPRGGAWFVRRMAQEVGVHRWDGAGGDFDAAFAVDGIDELLDEFSPLVGTDRFEGRGTSVHLHATDTDAGEWLVRLGPEAVGVERAHAKGDAAVRASASDLLLYAWNRIPLDGRFEVLGDRSAAERWSGVMTF